LLLFGLRIKLRAKFIQEVWRYLMIDPATIAKEHICEVNALVGEYSFRIDDIHGIEIRIKVWYTDRPYGGDRYMYTVSHNVHTPLQAGPYFPSAPFGSTERAALEKAVSDALTFYVSAISAGHEPSDTWFIVNDRF
jgi:hypothetical protein